ncbi:MAG: LLM class flavin-dependent oxidoreductase [Deltaproteobacteria bacterium]|nr:LLM class flavin-dependent oxidoreductase [Deltaproteobacteria bacterium]
MQRRAIALFTPTIRDMMEIAKLADEANFDSVWNGEFFNRNGLVTLMAVALNTKKTKIATGIAYAYMRNPVLNATGAMDIDEVSDGRLILGLGSGTKSMNEGWYGQPFETRSAAKMKECLGLIRKIWASHKGMGVRFEGEFYRIHIPAFSRPRAVRDRIPLYLAAVQKGMLRTVGETADGLVGHPLCSRRYFAEFIKPQVEIGAKRAGRALKDIDFTTLLITAISHDRQRAIQEAKNQIAFYASVKSYEGILNLHEWEQQKRAIWEHFKTFNLEKMAAAVTDEMVEQIAIAGTPEECREQLEKWDGLIGLPILYTPTAGVSSARILENHRLIVETFAQ